MPVAVPQAASWPHAHHVPRYLVGMRVICLRHESLAFARACCNLHSLADRHLIIWCAGECVVRQGWSSRSMWFVLSGFVDLVMDGAVVDTIQAEDYFGEVALLALPPTHELLQVLPLPLKPSFFRTCVVICACSSDKCTWALS